MTKQTKQFIENSKKCQSKTQYFASLENFVRKYLEHQVCYKRPETLQEDQKLLQNIILPNPVPKDPTKITRAYLHSKSLTC